VQIVCSQRATNPGIWAITAAMTDMSTYLAPMFWKCSLTERFETQSSGIRGWPSYCIRMHHLPPMYVSGLHSTAPLQCSSVRPDLGEGISLTEYMQVDAELAGLARCLKKPLRPMWISQNSRIWINQVPHPEDLPFTPIILVSASLPNARQRRFARECRSAEHNGVVPMVTVILAYSAANFD